jgi:ribonucleoside-diphosphate reductase beta chain
MTTKIIPPSSVMNMTSNSDHLFWGDSGHSLARYDNPRYPILLKVDEVMKGFYWRPVEIDVSQEKASFNKMTDADQHVFTSNLRRQILLDTIQARAPGLVFMPHVTDPTLENCINTWGFFESIHSESYTHIIRAVYPDPSVVFDGIPDIKEIVDCSDSISRSYDAFSANPNKETLYLALAAANVLEAIRFFVSFACSFSFAERGLMEGSAKVIKFIARDEGVHLNLVQNLVKILPKDDPEFVEIINDNREKASQMFDEAAQQERDWITYLFSHGSILGLTEKILNQYVDYLLPRRKFGFGLTTYRSKIENPIPWIDKWLSGKNVQVAPQEVEISSYKTGSVVNDLDETEFEL